MAGVGKPPAARRHSVRTRLKGMQEAGTSIPGRVHDGHTLPRAVPGQQATLEAHACLLDLMIEVERLERHRPTPESDEDDPNDKQDRLSGRPVHTKLARVRDAV